MPRPKAKMRPTVIPGDLQPILSDAVAPYQDASLDAVYLTIRVPVYRRMVGGAPVALPTKHFNRPFPTSEVRTLCDIRDGLRAIGAGPVDRNGRQTADPTHWDAIHWLLQQVAKVATHERISDE